MISPPLASVLIFAILVFSFTAIAITALVVGYLEKRNALRQRGRGEEPHDRHRSGSRQSSPPDAAP